MDIVKIEKLTFKSLEKLKVLKYIKDYVEER
jgi:hypothetical protein